MQIASFMCRHAWAWSERRQAERCRNCGKSRPGSDLTPVRPRANLERNDRALPEAFTEGAAVRTVGDAPASSVGRLYLTPARPTTLDQRLQALAAGDPLTQEDVIEIVFDLIKAIHDPTPVMSAEKAIEHYAALQGGRSLYGPRGH